MSRLSVLASVVVVLVGGRVAVGQTPAVESLYVRDYQDNVMSTTFEDLPTSVKTVTLPAGTAILTWSIRAWVQVGNPATLHVLPTIGSVTPLEGLKADLDNLSSEPRNLSGSWATQIDGSEVEVKLQARVNPNQTVTLNDGMTWTLIVFPETGAVPAISGIGLAVMAVIIIGVGYFVFSKFRRQAA